MTDVLYIAGLGRSGSTLVERVLGRFPETVSVGEVVHLWDRGLLQDERCGCGEPFSRCPFWSEVGERAFGGWHHLELDVIRGWSAAVDRTRHAWRLATGRGPRAFGRQLHGLREVLARLYPAMLAASGARVVLDSSKNPSYAFVLQGAPGIHMRAIQIVRDPRAVAHSWDRLVARPDSDSTLMARWSPAHTSVQWLAQNVLAGALPRVGVPTEVARYEDFVREPAATVDRLAVFADLGPSPDIIGALRARRVTLSPDHTVSGNPLRFRNGEVEIRADDAWRREMRPLDARIATTITSPLRTRFGYAGKY